MFQTKSHCVYKIDVPHAPELRDDVTQMKDDIVQVFHQRLNIQYHDNQRIYRTFIVYETINNCSVPELPVIKLGHTLVECERL